MIHEALKHLAVPIDKLIEDPDNARTHDEANMEAVRRSLTRFGQRLPIVVQDGGMIVRAGNARLQAAKDLGWTEIAALVVKEDDLEALAYALADNRTGEMSWFDTDTLAAVLRQVLEHADHLIDDMGFATDEIMRMTSPDGTDDTQVKMVQLFLDTESSPRFQDACEDLAGKFNTVTLSETVLAAVDAQYAKAASEGLL